VAADIRANHPEVWISVSATTRKPRPGETHGRHSWFVTDEETD
jgi:guanylate kinase